MHPITRTTIAFLISLAVQGCAVSYIDPKGREQAVGLFRQSVTHTDNLVIIERKVAGLSVDLVKDNGGVTFGYKETRRVYIEDESTIEITEDHIKVDTTP